MPRYNGTNAIIILKHMTKHYSIFPLLLSGLLTVSAACQMTVIDSLDTFRQGLSCTTGSAKAESPTSALLHATYAIKGYNAPSGSAYFYYSDTESDAAGLKANGTMVHVRTISAAEGSFASNLYDLEQRTTYHYMASITIDGTVADGEVKEFTTPAKPLVLSCETLSATEVLCHTATLSGTAEIQNAGDSQATVCFYYSTSLRDKESLMKNGTKLDAGTIPPTGGPFSAVLKDINDKTIVYFIAMASIDEADACGKVERFITEKEVPEGAVDLGVVSGYEYASDGWTWIPHKVFWGECNLGANAPEEFGDYYAWGELEPYYEDGYARSESPVWKEGKEYGYSWESHKWIVNGYPNYYFLKYCPSNHPERWGGEGEPDDLLELLRGEDGDDVVSRKFGGTWRMPTRLEMQALVEQCDASWVTRNGVLGIEFKSKVEGNDNSIFLPAAGSYYRTDYKLYGVWFKGVIGEYWTSSVSYPGRAHGLYFEQRDTLITRKLTAAIEGGLSIRPVAD